MTQEIAARSQKRVSGITIKAHHGRHESRKPKFAAATLFSTVIFQPETNIQYSKDHASSFQSSRDLPRPGKGLSMSVVKPFIEQREPAAALQNVESGVHGYQNLRPI